MKYRFTLIIAFLAAESNAQVMLGKVSKQKLELTFRLEGTKRKADSFSSNDTTNYGWDTSNPPYQPKNNYLAGNIGLKKYFKRNWIMSAEFRYKLWGFKEYFIVPKSNGQGALTEYGFSSTIINGDVSLNVLKDFMISERFSIRPRMGMTLFFPMQPTGDSMLYQWPGYSASMNYYVGKKYKTGVNMGVEFNYQLFRGISATFNTVYYTPFRNTANWVHAEWGTPAMYPVSRWTKKNDGLYLGLGLAIKLRK